MTQIANRDFFRFNYKKTCLSNFTIKEHHGFLHLSLESHLTVIGNPVFTSEQQSRN